MKSGALLLGQLVSTRLGHSGIPETRSAHPQGLMVTNLALEAGTEGVSSGGRAGHTTDDTAQGIHHARTRYFSSLRKLFRCDYKIQSYAVCRSPCLLAGKGERDTGSYTVTKVPYADTTSTHFASSSMGPRDPIN